VFLGLIFFSSGMAKLFSEHAFPSLIGPVWLEEKLAEHGLALYARFIAYMQLLTGFLLISQRFATLGALLLVPMLVNIFMITFSQQWTGTPWVVLVLLMMNLWLLYFDYHRLKFIFTDDPKVVEKTPGGRRFPFHDLVFLIGMFMVMLAPFLSHLSTGLAIFSILGGAAVCIGIQYYERKFVETLKKMNARK